MFREAQPQSSIGKLEVEYVLINRKNILTLFVRLKKKKKT